VNDRRSYAAEQNRDLNAITSLFLHWPEFAMEFAEMVAYLLLTCTLATLFQHPASPIHHLLPSSTVRRTDSRHVGRCGIFPMGT